MIIRNVSKEDIPDIIKIHMLSFSNFFLTSLGKYFLSVYYSSYLKLNNSVCLCADIGGNIVGFAFGAINSNGFNRKLIINNFFKYLPVFIVILFRNPINIIRLYKNANKQKSTKLNNFSELYSIAVDPNYAGRGIGKQLLSFYENIVKEKKVNLVILTTDYFNNETTINFYFKCGYEVYDIFIAYPKRKMYKLVKYLNK